MSAEKSVKGYEKLWNNKKAITYQVLELAVAYFKANYFIKEPFERFVAYIRQSVAEILWSVEFRQLQLRQASLDT